jgi:hypothetical protein
LTLILTIKIINLGVYEFHLMRRIPLKYFFLHSNCLKNIYEPEKTFSFKFMSGLCWLFEVIDEFIKVSKVR